MLLATLTRRLIRIAIGILLMAMLLPLTMHPKIAFAQNSDVTLTPTKGIPNTKVQATGNNWPSGDHMLVQWEDDGTILATTTVQSDGTFTVSFTIPSNAKTGNHYIDFVDQTAGYFIPKIFTVTATAVKTILNIEVTVPGLVSQPEDYECCIQVSIYNDHNQLVWDIQYDTANSYKISINLGASWTTGNYQVKLRLRHTLSKLVPGFFNIANGATTDLPSTQLYSGDINNDNVLSVADYNILVSCFGGKKCDPVDKENSDLDEDGTVGGVDYNIWLRNCQAVSCK